MESDIKYDSPSNKSTFGDALDNVILGLASWVGAEGIVRQMLSVGGDKYKNQKDAVNKLLREISSSRNLTSTAISNIENYLTELSNVGFIATGPALKALRRMQDSAKRKLENLRARQNEQEQSFSPLEADLASMSNEEYLTKREKRYQSDVLNRGQAVIDDLASKYETKGDNK